MRTARSFAVTIIFGFLVSWAILCPNPAYGADDIYDFIDLGTLEGYPHSYAQGINDFDQVVGYSVSIVSYSGPVYDFRPVLWENGKLSSIGTAPGSAADINNSGQIVGFATLNGLEGPVLWDQNGVVSLTDFGAGAASAINDFGQIACLSNQNPAHACIVKDGSLVDLDASRPLTSSRARDINNSGQVAGQSRAPGEYSHGTLWDNGTITDLGTLGTDWSDANAINDSGQIVGEYLTAHTSSTHPFLWQNGALTDLGTLGGGEASANDINNSGYVVGWSNPQDSGSRHAFLWAEDEMIDLNAHLPNDSPWTLYEATAINNHGSIVGWGTFSTGSDTVSRGFLLRPSAPSGLAPVPEPASVYLMGSGLLALAGWRRRRKS